VKRITNLLHRLGARIRIRIYGQFISPLNAVPKHSSAITDLATPSRLETLFLIGGKCLDHYALWKRALGLYPLSTSIPFFQGVSAWQLNRKKTF
jgi:hypothetical protein